ncbi:hypothetical protein [Bythopirellula goksoeyrii]|uniref:Membrane or secreted protein n=1 Tax=Bythopirellula goksoeyrii TaxID=1400387 RepID=A0A5B9Q4X5_9BACT|nr:hypothetical protein [Bythopirellula goksoeyrii]QEG32790.1 hypothetical protein Pr1d_00500 [Bythopirellula goksoeyrii]
MNRNLFPTAGACLLLLFAIGCSPTIRMPKLLHPGTAAYQRYNAELFDPYPQNDMGPKIDGGRPIDYQYPINQVERARQPMPVGPWRMGSRY